MNLLVYNFTYVRLLIVILLNHSIVGKYYIPKA